MGLAIRQASGQASLKRTRKRKVRTQQPETSSDSPSSSSSSSSSEVSSSSSEDDSNDTSEQDADSRAAKAHKTEKLPDARPDKGSEVNAAASSQLRQGNVEASSTAPSDPFEAWYIRAMTTEFGEDLEKLRNAPDFKDSSVPILIQALKQGASLFTKSQRDSILQRTHTKS